MNKRIVQRLTGGAFARRLGIVSGLTLVSRASGFLRDIVIAATLGNGALADAFFVALRLPNHFRAIFAEGAFNAAFVPTYTAVKTAEGDAAARRVSGQILVALIIIQLIVLAAAEIWTQPFIDFLAPKFGTGSEWGRLTLTLTRITFPYLACVTIVTLYSGVLNAHQKFAAAAAAPILFNLGTMAGLAAERLFPTAAHAAAVGVVAAGMGEIALVWWAARRAGILPVWGRPALTGPTRTFLRRLGPALIGSGTAQIAIFADTILAAALPAGAVSALYYADRLYQLPVGVLAVALGTVLLPDLSARYARGDIAGARRARMRALMLGLIVAVPFVIAFTVFSDGLIQLAFARGRFDAAAVPRAAATLAAYGIGLPAVIMLRPVVAGFQARGDTRTPMFVGLAVIGINVAAKIVLTGVLDVQGLALGTSLAAWANVIVLLILLERRDRQDLGDSPAAGG